MSKLPNYPYKIKLPSQKICFTYQTPSSRNINATDTELLPDATE